MKGDPKFYSTLYEAIRVNFAVAKPWLICFNEMEENADVAKAFYFGLIHEEGGSEALEQAARFHGVSEYYLKRYMDVYNEIKSVEVRINKHRPMIKRYSVKKKLIKNYFKYAGVEFRISA